MSFFKSVENAFSKLFGKAPSALQKAQSVLSFAAPVVKLVLAEVDPKDAAEVGNVIGEVQSDISTASAVISQSHGSAPDSTAIQTVATSLNAVNNNLAALLAAGHIKNAATQAKVGAVAGELNAVISSLATS